MHLPVATEFFLKKRILFRPKFGGCFSFHARGARGGVGCARPAPRKWRKFTLRPFLETTKNMTHSFPLFLVAFPEYWLVSFARLGFFLEYYKVFSLRLTVSAYDFIIVVLHYCYYRHITNIYLKITQIWPLKSAKLAYEETYLQIIVITAPSKLESFILLLSSEQSQSF